MPLIHLRSQQYAMPIIRVLCLCLLLLPGLALAQSTDGRLEPDNAPIPITGQPSEDANGQIAAPREQRTEDALAQGIGEEISSALETGAGGFALLIPILFIIFVFGGPVIALIVFGVLHYRSKNEKARLHAETVLRALETGRELPPDLFNEQGTEAADNLKKGVKNIGLGAGLLIALSMVNFKLGAIGFILLGIGAAQLVLWKLSLSDKKEAA